MKSRSEFWLTLHKLAHDLEREGDDPNERAQNLCAVLNSLPPATRDVYLSNMNSVAEMLGNVMARCYD
jgi:hypothetical protein